MTRKRITNRIVSLLGALAMALGLFAASTVAAGPGNVTITVTAVGKKDTVPPAVTKDDVQFYLNKERTQVAAWAKAEKLYLAVLIDDSLDSSVANQWSDLKAFFDAQPATTYISVAYVRNGTAMLAQDFTNDHELAAKALRIPIGSGGAFSSPYLSLLDLMKRWPSSGDRRSILLISSGIDYFRGGFGPKSPDLDTAIERAQKQNINIWSIYAPDAGHRSRGFFRVSNAQSNLSQLSDETGGESYYLGTERARHVQTLFGRDRHAPQQPVPFDLQWQRRKERTIRARSRSHRTSKGRIPGAFAGLSAASAVRSTESRN